MTEKKEVERIRLPEGRVINQSLFVRDQFNETASPTYKIELAFNPDDLRVIEEALAAAAVEKWGAGADNEYFDNKLGDPIIDGEVLKKRREEKGKPGDAYAGQLIIRAHTKFNKHGEDGPGGIQVFNEKVEEIEGVESREIYNGCYGMALVTIGTYVDSKTQVRSLMFYLSAFQKTRDGDPLVSAADHSNAFKPVGRDAAAGEEASQRRRRAG